MGQAREFRIGIVGCGRISQAYVQAIQACDHIKLAAVMDTRAATAQSSAEAAGCRAFTDLDSFIKDAGIEGAIICTPPNDHKAVACALLDKGIHVLCEKPFATTLADANAMVAKARERERVLMMASKFRYVEDIIRAKAMIESGMLGEVVFYENRFCSKVNMRGRWNADPTVAGGGVIIDNGTHSVDIVRYLVGPVTSIHAHEGKRVMALPVEDTVSLSVVTDTGVSGTVYLSWAIQIEQGGYISIYGTDGALTIGWKESKYQHGSHPEWISFGVGYNKVEAFKNQVANFVGTVRGSATPVIGMEDGLASVKVIEAAYRSMHSHQWVELENES